MLASSAASVESTLAGSPPPSRSDGPTSTDGRPPVLAAGHRGASVARLIESELVPRLLMAHRGGDRPSLPAPAAADGAAALTPEIVASFVAAVRGPDDARAVAFVQELLRGGTTVEAIYLGLLAPAARELGALWDDDECDFVEVTVALGRMQRILRELSQVFLADAVRSDASGHVLLTCVPGEQHTLGLIMVAEFLLRDGYRVLVGAPWTESDLLTLVRTEWFDVVGFSAGCESRLGALKREIQRVRAASRNGAIRVLVGGQIFGVDPELVQRVGADGWARDAREAPAVTRTLIAAAAAGNGAASTDADTPHAPLRSPTGGPGAFVSDPSDDRGELRAALRRP